MERKLFYIKKKYKLYFLFPIFSLIFIYISIIIYTDINQKYFIIDNQSENNYYFIPDDKEGEKVKYIDKKSINDFTRSDYNLKKIEDLKYTIQLYSDINYESIENYLTNLTKLKSHIFVEEDLYIFSISSQIGIDYFITYKNFTSKDDAMKYCNKLSFIKKCLVVNPQN